VLEGAVNVVNEGMVGLICYNYFNVAAAKESLPEGWSWDGEGWTVGDEKVEVGRKVKCRVEDFEASGSEGLSISASVVGEVET
jgi:DNA-directed RNA polymerase I subunit RPA43